MTTGNKFSAAGHLKNKKAGSSGNPSRHSLLIRLLLETKRCPVLGYHHPTSPATKNLKGDKIYCPCCYSFQISGGGVSNLCQQESLKGKGTCFWLNNDSSSAWPYPSHRHDWVPALNYILAEHLSNAQFLLPSCSQSCWRDGRWGRRPRSTSTIPLWSGGGLPLSLPSAFQWGWI